MKRLFSFLFVILVVKLCLAGAVKKLQLVEKWEHKEEIPGTIYFSVVDKDGNLACAFFLTGNRLITPKKIVPFAPIGQGPSDVSNVCWYSLYRDNDLAIMENPMKIKIFQKRGDIYDWKETVWLKRSHLFQIPHCAVFSAGKWFIGGYECLNDDHNVVSWLKVHDEKGFLLKNDIITFKYSKEEVENKMLHSLRRNMVKFEDRIFYFVENELRAYVVSMRELKLERTVNLKPPYFYKKMPADFFNFKRYPDQLLGMKRDFDKWYTSYSRITRVVVDRDHLILQIRTCDPKLEKFALLVYNANTWGEEGIIFTNDLLLGAKDGKLYCFGGGDPGLDDGITKTVINIYNIN